MMRNDRSKYRQQIGDSYGYDPMRGHDLRFRFQWAGLMSWSTPEARRIPGGDIGFLGNVPASAPNIFSFSAYYATCWQAKTAP